MVTAMLCRKGKARNVWAHTLDVLNVKIQRLRADGWELVVVKGHENLSAPFVEVRDA